MLESDVNHVLYPNSGAAGTYTDPGPVRGRRFTQDTPILPEVWIAYAVNPELAKKRGVLLTPNSDSSVRDLVVHLRASLAKLRGETEARRIFLAYNESHVIAHLTFDELIRCVLPLSVWWDENIGGADIHAWLRQLSVYPDLPQLLLEPGRQIETVSSDVLDMIRVAGAIALNESPRQDRDYFLRLLAALESLFEGFTPYLDFEEPPLWSVFSCRPVQSAVSQSRISVKADAAIRVFDLSCKDIVWAVVDSGIDADHDAFLRWPVTDAPKSRVIRSYDFTRITRVLEAAFQQDAMDQLKVLAPGLDEDKLRDIAADLGARLISGQALDWGLLEPLLLIRPAADGKTPPPVNEHGTHVAGILAADWRKLREGELKPYPGYREPAKSVTGVCPDLLLYDLRVIKDDGTGDEFSVLSALQFVRYLNTNKDKMVIHGVNLSFSLPQLVKSFGCGSSPVCLESERLVNSGVVVVAAAGNRGYIVANDGFEWYRSLSITDPGNADAVITVGATHRTEPHRYGVSYFSSRGPTGDGRMKPDLVAPGEKIHSIIPGGGNVVALDGTSMAAPHVSGAAALLMARHRELMGRPRKVKEVLCATATDLGRERFFQGAGMLDVLRALQSI
jgi:serine protease AprX